MNNLHTYLVVVSLCSIVTSDLDSANWLKVFKVLLVQCQGYVDTLQHQQIHRATLNKMRQAIEVFIQIMFF